MSSNEQGKQGKQQSDAGEAIEQTARSPYTKMLARFGFVSKGVIFNIIGGLALLVAIGDSSGKLTGARGALATIAQGSLGQVMFLTLACGAIIFGLWNVLRGIADIDHEGGDTIGVAKRLFAGGLGIFYFFVGVSALYFYVMSRRGTGGSDDEVPRTITRILLEFPLGEILVGLIGLGFVTAAGIQIYLALSRDFLGRFKTFIAEKYLRVIIVLGTYSYLAQSVLSFLIGYFFITAALNYDPQEAVGLDGALTTLASKAYGTPVLFFTAVGLISHGLLTILEAKFRRLE